MYRLTTLKEEVYKGLPASKGISMGKPFIYRAETPSYDFFESDGVLSPKKEITEYRNAIEQSRKELNKIFNLAKEKLDEKNLQIFEAHILFLDDEELHKKVISRIEKENKPAYKVISEEIKEIENKLIASSDEYIRERVSDIEDIKSRILRNLTRKKLFSKIDENCIVISRNLTPADTILFSNRKLLGFATDLGGTNSHVALIARSLNVPAVVGMNDISLHVKTSDYLIIDGYKGLVIKNPSRATQEKYKTIIKRNKAFEKSLAELEKLPTRTIDGKDISLTVNLEFNKEIDYVLTHIGCGVGLYRTEHLFLELGDFPTEHYQYQQYKQLADRLYPNQVTIRTFDIGGDKLLPESQRELNPFLGWRGIRICLDKKDIFMAQLRAILRASKHCNLKIMFPMITSLDEILLAKEMLKKAKKELKSKRVNFDDKIKVGIMIEVPSAVWIADSLAKEVDFFSIGTNDLVQYILAVDRDSNLVSDLYQKFHPAVINAIYSVAECAARNNIGLSVCGEMAGDPYASLLLIGLGVNELSVETTSFLRIKRLIRMISFSDSQNIAKKALAMNKEKDIRELLEKSYRKIVQ